MGQLSQKEQLFCRIYSNTRNAKESAARAGYSLFLEKTGEKLLSKKEIKSEVKRLDKGRFITKSEVCAGLKRIAFGSVNDALKLLDDDCKLDEEQLNSLDLFNVSDIKKPKNGGIEIKFFDRQKALEKLFEISCEDKSDEIMPFYDALEKSARVLAQNEEEDDSE